MKTREQLLNIISSVECTKIDAHVHTHLCDGKPEMTVKNIADAARARGIELCILTPHFHKRVSDATATLYDDTNEEILLKLRNEIDEYDGDVKILLSTEADILDKDGKTALNVSQKAYDALDCVTPTLNYHPLLPLKCVEVTYSACIEEIYKSGYFAHCAGDIENVIESVYTAQANAIKKAPTPAILGHFFAAHSMAVKGYSWFNMQPRHINIMKEGASAVIDACKNAGAIIDITGIHLKDETHEQKRQRDSFFYDFQTWFISECRKKGVMLLPGSDAHSLKSVGNVDYYKTLL